MDTNGPDDFSVTSFGDEDIISVDDIGVSFASMMSTDAESFSLSIRRFSGIKEIYEVAKETLFHMEITTASGNLRVVAVRDKKIVYEFDINGSCDVTLEKGTVLKICGESAELKIRIEKQ